MVGDSLVVKQLRNRATWLYLSHGQATVARGVPAVMPLLSEGPGSLVREEATKSRMRNLIRICGQRRCFRAFFDARPFCSSLPHSLSLSAPHFLRHIHVDATRSKYIKVRRDQVQRQRRTPQDSRIFEHLAKLTRQRSRDGGRRPRADIWWCALYDHPER